MRLSVFDKDVQGLPTEKPKAVIELTNVGDRESMAKIISQVNTSDPMHNGDKVYSIAIGNRQFALIGKLDMNRDGKDDRADVKRLIEMSGGKVTYELPPPGKGHEAGKLDASIDWLITDELPPIYTRDIEVREPNAEDSEFMKRRTDIINEARSLGIRPMPLNKLAAYLGYTHGTTLPGSVEAINTRESHRLQNRKGNSAPLPSAKPKDADAPKDPADEPK